MTRTPSFCSCGAQLLLFLRQHVPRLLLLLLPCCLQDIVKINLLKQLPCATTTALHHQQACCCLLLHVCSQDIVNIILFNVVPQMIDIVVACSYLATKMQPWVAGIVLVTVSSYVPLTVCITERRGKVGAAAEILLPFMLCLLATEMLHARMHTLAV
jgi:hypothetical protein